MSLTSTKSTSAAGDLTQAYLSEIRQKLLMLVALILLLIVLSFFAIIQGAYDIPFRELALTLVGSGADVSRVVIVDLRMTRVAAAIVCGWGLALSGLGLQSLLKNNLGSPFTLGLSQGAAFGSTLAVLLFHSHLTITAVSAFIGTLLAIVIIIILSRMKHFSPQGIILAGVAISAFFHSGMMLLHYLVDQSDLARVVYWTFGDMVRSNWRQITLIGVVTLLVTLYLFRLRWDLNALAAGEETAQGLGINVETLRIFSLTALTLVIALVTAYHGMIAFVGLITPHMARRLVGNDHRLLIPFTAVGGAILLLTADTAGRMLMGSGELPVGVITSLLGAPMFLYLLVRRYH